MTCMGPAKCIVFDVMEEVEWKRRSAMAEIKQDDNFAFDAIVKANQQMDAEDEAEQQANPIL